MRAGGWLTLQQVVPSLTQAQIIDLSQGWATIELEAGVRLTGEMPDKPVLYLIDRGSVGLFESGSTEARVTLGVGALLGDMPLLGLGNEPNDGTYATWWATTRPSRLYTLSEAQVTQLILQLPQLGLSALKQQIP